MASQSMTFKAEFKTPKVQTTGTSKKERLKALEALSKAITKGSTAVEEALAPALDEAMEANVWDWPRKTTRANGTTVSAPRNIVDTGTLKDSLKITTKYLKTKTVFNVSYLAPYAWMVHEGGYIKPFGSNSLKAVYIPGRPWVKAALEGGVRGVSPVDYSGIMYKFVGSSF